MPLRIGTKEKVVPSNEEIDKAFDDLLESLQIQEFNYASSRGWYIEEVAAVLWMIVASGSATFIAGYIYLYYTAPHMFPNSGDWLCPFLAVLLVSGIYLIAGYFMYLHEYFIAFFFEKWRLNPISTFLGDSLINNYSLSSAEFKERRRESIRSFTKNHSKLSNALNSGTPFFRIKEGLMIAVEKRQHKEFLSKREQVSVEREKMLAEGQLSNTLDKIKNLDSKLIKR